jgi:hypothetical protein
MKKEKKCPLQAVCGCVLEGAFIVQGPTVWNRVPLHIHNAPSLDTLKKYYRKEILALEVPITLLHHYNLTATWGTTENHLWVRLATIYKKN